MHLAPKRKNKRSICTWCKTLHNSIHLYVAACVYRYIGIDIILQQCKSDNTRLDYTCRFDLILFPYICPGVPLAKPQG